MLYALVFGALPTARDEKRRYFVRLSMCLCLLCKVIIKHMQIDRDGTSFRHVLNFMRSGYDRITCRWC